MFIAIIALFLILLVGFICYSCGVTSGKTAAKKAYELEMKLQNLERRAGLRQ